MDLGDFFGKRPRSVARPAVAAVPNFPNDSQRPSWAAQGTAYFAAIDRSMSRLRGEDTQPLFPVDVESDDAPSSLVWREPMAPAAAGAAKRWQTEMGHEVTIGDLVAFRARGQDHKGRIVKAAADGAAECEIGTFSDPIGSRSRPTLRIPQDDLVALLINRREVDPVKKRTYINATPATRDPDKDEQDENGEGGGAPEPV